MKGLEKPEDVALVRILAAAVALHAVVSRADGMNRTREAMIDDAFAIGDAFVARAQKEAPP